MQQRVVTTMDSIESDGQLSPPPPHHHQTGGRGRNNSKLKVLGRSHAMREEASPPRESLSPQPLSSPRIKLTPSDGTNGHHPLLVLSPSGSPCHDDEPCLSPTSTLVPSPVGHSSPQRRCEHDPSDSSPKVSRLNRQNLEQQRYNGRQLQRTDIIVEEGHLRKGKCDCTSHSYCSCQRNYNNNLSNSNNNNMGSQNTLTVHGRSSGGRGRLRHQGSSSQGSFEGSSSNSPCLSRDNSSEQYTDTTGVDLEQFIPETLNRNAKDRALMLRIEEELVQLAKDKVKTHFKFPPMSSYQRMLVHRCAAYFGMDHNIEASGKCVVVNKTKNTRIPDIEFRVHVKEDIVFSEEPRRSILKRDSNSVEDYGFKSPDRHGGGMESRRSKSFEEREEEYVKARRRIFNKEMHDSGSTDDMCWTEVPWSSTESENLSRHRLYAGEHNGRSNPRLLKVQSEDPGEETQRPCVAKSYSFGGYGGVLTRGDSVMSTHSAGPRLLTKQDSASSSVSWRLSPSSSGYKTQSQRSESVTPSPTSTPYLSGESTRQDSTNSTATNVSDLQTEEESTPVVWAVTKISNVPKGSLIINPQTGKPMKNQDGTIYHHDPDNPIPELQPSPTNAQPSSKPPPSPVRSPQKTIPPPSPKKRTSTKSSPIKKMNSSTSPSLPYTPPTPPAVMQQSRSFTFGQNEMHPAQPPPPQHYQTVYTATAASFPAPAEASMYQQPCIVFAPYGSHVPVGYNGQMDNQVQDMSGYYNIPETPPQVTYQTVAPPPPNVWNQPLPYYQNAQPPSTPTRYTAVPVPQQSAYVSPYQSPYLQTAQSVPAPAQPPPQPPPADMVPVYQQPILYPSQPAVYPVFAPQNPGYPVYTQQNVQYPPNTPTPNSCASSVSGTPFQYDLVQAMGQVNVKGTSTPKPLKAKNSSQPESPSMTVFTSGYPQQAYVRPPDTPPASFVSPMFFRQMSNVRASPPVTSSRGSRSPTPASEPHIDRQRFHLPPLLYQGMPYPMSDGRLVAGRGQPAAYRQTPPPPPMRPQPPMHLQQQQQHQQHLMSLNGGQHQMQQQQQQQEAKIFKNRRSRGNRSNLPPNGKQQQQQQPHN